MSLKNQRGNGILTDSNYDRTSLFTDTGDYNQIKQIYYILGNIYGMFYVEIKELHSVAVGFHN